jgi:hypothetical protein
MKSVQDVSMLPSLNQKFMCPVGTTNGTFTIFNSTVGQEVVDCGGTVLDPPMSTLFYSHQDTMVCNSCGYTGRVTQFLTVDPSMDTPDSIAW